MRKLHSKMQKIIINNQQIKTVIIKIDVNSNFLKSDWKSFLKKNLIEKEF